MTGADFTSVLAGLLEPDLKALGYVAEAPTIDGRHYSATFTAAQVQVVVSYEPGDDFLEVFFFRRSGSGWSDIDDVRMTPRLADLNRRYSDGLADAVRDRPFGDPIGDDPAVRRLVQAIGQIGIVLPAYMEDIRSEAY